jgi:hypothetical protein
MDNIATTENQGKNARRRGRNRLTCGTAAPEKDKEVL